MFQRFRHNRLLSASALLLLSSTLVNGGNYLSNLVLGRWLGPAAFAEANLIVTLLLMLALVSTTLQTVLARFAAQASDESELLSLRRWALGWAWGLGLGLALLLMLVSPVLAAFFHLASALPLLLLALALPFAFALGVERGCMQGTARFVTLALNYQAEMWVRLLATVALLALGMAVPGVALALLLSLLAAWLLGQSDGLTQRHKGTKAWRINVNLPSFASFAALRRCSGQALRETSFRCVPVRELKQWTALPPERRALLAYAGPVALALLGQLLMTNADVLLVKRRFPGEIAGHYAALALASRIIFFATWSVVTTLFPLVAQRQSRGEPHGRLLLAGLGLVGAVAGPLLVLFALLPEQVLGLLFGAAFVAAAPLLGLAAVSTTLYALANVVISYRLALGDGGGSYLALLTGVLLIVLLAWWPTTLQQVIVVQLALMTALLGTLLLRQARFWKTPPTEYHHVTRSTNPSLHTPE
jgi:O-antigen/teichoic acid export membrane protein